MDVEHQFESWRPLLLIKDVLTQFRNHDVVSEANFIDFFFYFTEIWLHRFSSRVSKRSLVDIEVFLFVLLRLILHV